MTTLVLFSTHADDRAARRHVPIFESQMATIDRRMRHLLTYQYTDKITHRIDPEQKSSGFPTGVYQRQDSLFQIADGSSSGIGSAR